MIGLRYQNGLTCLIALAFIFYYPSPSLPNYNKTLHYEAIKNIDLVDSLPGPPREGSAKEKQDLAAVIDAQVKRTPAQITLARLDTQTSVFRFEPVLGKNFNGGNLPLTAVFFKKIEQDVGFSVYRAKIHYKRPRPFTESKLINPIIPRPANSSYPSGHSTYAYVTALLLSKMLPEKRDQIFKRAREFANNRVVDGVHYPSDVAAGKLSATIIVHDLFLNKEFVTDFNSTQNEVRQILENDTGKNRQALTLAAR
jgi:acid phosphatase (class A)